MKFKVGQRVSLDENGEEGTIRFVGESLYGVQRDDGKGGSGPLYNKKHLWLCNDSDVTLVKTDLEHLYEGATLVSDDDIRDVLAVLGGTGKARVYLLSRNYKNDLSEKNKVYSFYTAFELDKLGCKIRGEEEVQEVTMEEVCEKFGHDVKIKK